MKKIVIVGGGASGLAAAITAARNGAEVVLLEKKEQLGKKLSVTGNGRCNFSNRNMSPAYYHGHHIEFVERILADFTTDDAVEFMHSVGILETEKNGGLYPVNLQAQSVTATLSAEVKRLNVTVVTGADVTSIRKKGAQFTVQASTGTYTADAVIMACGSEAGVRDKNPYTAVKILKSLGVKVYEQHPVLVPLYGKNGVEDWWNGVRMTGSVSFNGITESGELQMTKEGISGIPVFQISHVVSEALKKSKEVQLTLDLLPEYSEEALGKFFGMRAAACCEAGLSANQENISADKGGLSSDEVLQGILPKKMIPIVTKKAGFRRDERIKAELSVSAQKLIKTVKSFPYTVYGTGDIAAAQAVSGGVDTEEMTDDMEVQKIPGLFVTGELLDIDGACGGYNLHFAWATGIKAGKRAAEPVGGIK